MKFRVQSAKLHSLKKILKSQTGKKTTSDRNYTCWANRGGLLTTALGPARWCGPRGRWRGAGSSRGGEGRSRGRRWAWRGQRLRRGAALASEEQKQQPQVQATDGGTWREGRAATRRRGLSAGRERRWGGGAPFPATAEGGGRRLLLPVQHKSEREM